MDLEKEIKKIQERNKRVELDKAWETSWTRKICIMILTYIVVIIYSYVIRKYDNIKDMLNAVTKRSTISQAHRERM